jgi:tripartite-type tricarboxylate transporter receptor subunit TctC
MASPLEEEIMNDVFRWLPRPMWLACEFALRLVVSRSWTYFTREVFAGLIGLALSTCSFAEPYPNRPIKILVPFPPGGGVDFTTRLIAPKLSEDLRQQIIVENKAGAAGVIALSEVARAAPDGYTLVVGNIGPLVLAPNMMRTRPYDPIKDFTPIGQIVSTYLVATVPSNHPANSLREFVAWAKQNEGKVSFASGGSGSISHLSGEALNQVAGISMTHVPYKGTAPAVTDLIGGQIHILIDAVNVIAPQVKGGKLKALAVTSPLRVPELPTVPTMREAGFPALEVSGWQGLLGPAGMPRDIVRRLAVALKSALISPEVKDRFLQAGTPVTERDADAFSVYIKSENESWSQVIKASGAKID